MSDDLFSRIENFLFDSVPGYEALGQGSEKWFNLNCFLLGVVCAFLWSFGGVLEYAWPMTLEGEEMSLFSKMWEIFMITSFPVFVLFLGQHAKKETKPGMRNSLRMKPAFRFFRGVSLVFACSFILGWLTLFGEAGGFYLMVQSIKEIMWMSAIFFISCTPLPPGSAKGKFGMYLASLKAQPIRS